MEATRGHKTGRLGWSSPPPSSSQRAYMSLSLPPYTGGEQHENQGGSACLLPPGLDKLAPKLLYRSSSNSNISSDSNNSINSTTPTLLIPQVNHDLGGPGCCLGAPHNPSPWGKRQRRQHQTQVGHKTFTCCCCGATQEAAAAATLGAAAGAPTGEGPPHIPTLQCDSSGVNGLTVGSALPPPCAAARAQQALPPATAAATAAAAPQQQQPPQQLGHMSRASPSSPAHLLGMPAAVADAAAAAAASGDAAALQRRLLRQQLQLQREHLMQHEGGPALDRTQGAQQSLLQQLQMLQQQQILLKQEQQHPFTWQEQQQQQQQQHELQHLQQVLLSDGDDLDRQIVMQQQILQEQQQVLLQLGFKGALGALGRAQTPAPQHQDLQQQQQQQQQQESQSAGQCNNSQRHVLLLQQALEGPKSEAFAALRGTVQQQQQILQQMLQVVQQQMQHFQQQRQQQEQKHPLREVSAGLDGGVVVSPQQQQQQQLLSVLQQQHGAPWCFAAKQEQQEQQQLRGKHRQGVPRPAALQPPGKRRVKQQVVDWDLAAAAEEAAADAAAAAAAVSVAEAAPGKRRRTPSAKAQAAAADAAAVAAVVSAAARAADAAACRAYSNTWDWSPHAHQQQQQHNHHHHHVLQQPSQKLQQQQRQAASSFPIIPTARQARLAALQEEKLRQQQQRQQQQQDKLEQYVACLKRESQHQHERRQQQQQQQHVYRHPTWRRLQQLRDLPALRVLLLPAKQQQHLSNGPLVRADSLVDTLAEACHKALRLLAQHGVLLLCEVGSSSMKTAIAAAATAGASSSSSSSSSNCVYTRQVPAACSAIRTEASAGQPCRAAAAAAAAKAEDVCVSERKETGDLLLQEGMLLLAADRQVDSPAQLLHPPQDIGSVLQRPQRCREHPLRQQQQQQQQQRQQQQRGGASGRHQRCVVCPRRRARAAAGVALYGCVYAVRCQQQQQQRWDLLLRWRHDAAAAASAAAAAGGFVYAQGTRSSGKQQEQHQQTAATAAAGAAAGCEQQHAFEGVHMWGCMRLCASFMQPCTPPSFLAANVMGGDSIGRCSSSSSKWFYLDGCLLAERQRLLQQQLHVCPGIVHPSLDTCSLLRDGVQVYRNVVPLEEVEEIRRLVHAHFSLLMQRVLQQQQHQHWPYQHSSIFKRIDVNVSEPHLEFGEGPLRQVHALLRKKLRRLQQRAAAALAIEFCSWEKIFVRRQQQQQQQQEQLLQLQRQPQEEKRDLQRTSGGSTTASSSTEPEDEETPRSAAAATAAARAGAAADADEAASCCSSGGDAGAWGQGGGDEASGSLKAEEETPAAAAAAIAASEEAADDVYVEPAWQQITCGYLMSLGPHDNTQKTHYDYHEEAHKRNIVSGFFPLVNITKTNSPTAFFLGTQILSSNAKRGDLLLMDNGVRHRGSSHTAFSVRPLIYMSLVDRRFCGAEKVGSKTHFLNWQQYAQVPQLQQQQQQERRGAQAVAASDDRDAAGKAADAATPSSPQAILEPSTADTEGPQDLEQQQQQQQEEQQQQQNEEEESLLDLSEAEAAAMNLEELSAINSIDPLLVLQQQTRPQSQQQQQQQEQQQLPCYERIEGKEGEAPHIRVYLHRMHQYLQRMVLYRYMLCRQHQQSCLLEA
ncbi:hypothetical protein ACSSS7_005664 [Eimeria intestinalis]